MYELNGKQITEEIGCAKVAQACLLLQEINRPTNKHLSFFNKDREVGRFVANFELLNNIKDIHYFEKSLEEKLRLDVKRKVGEQPMIPTISDVSDGDRPDWSIIVDLRAGSGFESKGYQMPSLFAEVSWSKTLN